MPLRTILNFIDDHIPTAAKLSFVTFLSTLTWMDMVDWMAKGITGLITIILFWYAHIRHRQEMKNKKTHAAIFQKQLEQFDQEEYKRIQQTKRIT
jgi:flagellar biosynthesis/type III secretory pathway M-ring protein FliF/YscJ